MLRAFEKETKQLCVYVKPPKPLSYYYEIANKSLDFISDFPDHKY